MKVTVFPDRFALEKTEHEFTLAELVALIEATTAESKHDLPLLKLATFGEKRTPRRENGRGGNSLRHDENVIQVYGVECDYDGEVVSFEEALAQLADAGVAAILYASPSHAPAKPRWRVLFPLATPVAPADRRALADRANGLLGGCLSRETWTLSQAYYFGRVGDAFRLVATAGRALDELTHVAGLAFDKTADDYADEALAPSGYNPFEATPSNEATSVEDLPPKVKRVIKSGDPKRFNFSTRNHMVFYVACSLVRAGWTDEAIAALIADPAQPVSAHVREQNNPRAYALKQARDAREKQKEDWERAPGSNRIIDTSQRNIRRGIAGLGASLYRDEFAGRDFVNGASGPLRELSDDEVIALRLAIDTKFGFLPRRELFYDVLIDTARRAPVHPLRELLARLEAEWDGVKRLGELPENHEPGTAFQLDDATGKPRGVPGWLTTYGGAADTDLHRLFGRIHLIAGVRRVRQPGCEYQQMLVFVNPTQGTNKSGAVRALALDPRWLCMSLPLHARDQEVIEQLKGKWLVEFGELHGFKHSDVEHLKNFMSKPFDRARPAYGRLPVEVQRQSLFFGTTNSVNFLRDERNRRYWPVEVPFFDLELLSRDVRQLWGEAATYESRGESITLDPAYWEGATDLQWDFRQADPWVEVINETVRDLQGKITGNDVWKILRRPEHARQTGDDVRLGLAMRELGFERRKARVYGTPVWCYMRGTAETRNRQLYVLVDPTDPRAPVYCGLDPSGIDPTPDGGPDGDGFPETTFTFEGDLP